MGPRIAQGDDALLSVASSVVTRVDGKVQIRGDDGRDYTLRVPQVTLVANQTTVNLASGGSPVGGVVTSAYIGHAGGLQRGQTPAALQLRRGGQVYTELCKGYLNPFTGLSLGQLNEIGPASGTGHIQNRALASDVTPADIEHTLGISGTLRRIDGFIWWYHCDGNAGTRTLRVSLRDMGDGLPTGMTSGGNTTTKRWPSAAALSLIVNQEGLIYVNAAEGKSYAADTDNGAVPTIEDITTQPDPLPYWAQASDVGELFFDVTDPLAGDRHSIYVIEEEWVLG